MNLYFLFRGDFRSKESRYFPLNSDHLVGKQRAVLIYQFVIFKPLSCCFQETIGFDVKSSLASRPMSRLIRWYNKPGDITKKFWEKAIQFHGIFHRFKITNWYGSQPSKFLPPIWWCFLFLPSKVGFLKRIFLGVIYTKALYILRLFFFCFFSNVMIFFSVCYTSFALITIKRSIPTILLNLHLMV